MGRIISAMLCIVLLLASCGTVEAQPEVEPGPAADYLVEALDFRDSLISADKDIVGNYYRLTDEVEAFAVYISGSGATAEEIAVLRVSEGNSVDVAVGILNRRVEELVFRFESYVPEEMVKLGSPVIVTRGRTAILVLSDDPDAEAQAQAVLTNSMES